MVTVGLLYNEQCIHSFVWILCLDNLANELHNVMDIHIFTSVARYIHKKEMTTERRNSKREVW